MRARRAISMEVMLFAAALLLIGSPASVLLYAGATVILPAALLWPAPAHRGILQAWAHVRARLKATLHSLVAVARTLVETRVPSSPSRPARLVDDPPPALRPLISSRPLRASPLR